MIGDLISTMANAQKLSIQQIQKGVQDGSIPSYIGVPLIEQKTKQMQQAAAALQGQQGRNQPPIAQQVMQAADQVTRPEVPPTPTPSATDRQRPAPSLGLEAARSNMPEQYAGGGIVAFGVGGPTAAGYEPSEIEAIRDYYAGGRDPRFTAQSERMLDMYARHPNVQYTRKNIRTAAQTAFDTDLANIQADQARREMFTGKPPSSYQLRAATQAPTPEPIAAGNTVRSLEGRAISPEAESYLAKAGQGLEELGPVASKAGMLSKIGRVASPLGWGLGVYDMASTIADPNVRKQFAEDWNREWFGEEPPATPTTPTDVDMINRIRGIDGSAPQGPSTPPIDLRAARGAVPPSAAAPTRPGVDSLAAPATAPQAQPATAQPETAAPETQPSSARTSRDELRDLILGQKADRADEEKQNLSTALMKAGFGMMAGRSPFAGVNIGEGAMAGVESYGKGIEQLRAGDRQIIQQLVGLGLKGEELDNAAAKLGVDMQEAKAREKYYDMMGAYQRAHIPGLQAQAKYTEAKALDVPKEREQAEQQLRINEYVATHSPTRAAGNRSVRVDPEASRIDREDYASWIDSPLNPSNPFFSELSAALEADPRARVALKDKDSDNYNWALNKYVIPLAKRHAALKKQANLTQVSSGYENDQDTE